MVESAKRSQHGIAPRSLNAANCYQPMRFLRKMLAGGAVKFIDLHKGNGEAALPVKNRGRGYGKQVARCRAGMERNGMVRRRNVIPGRVARHNQNPQRHKSNEKKRRKICGFYNWIGGCVAMIMDNVFMKTPAGQHCDFYKGAGRWLGGCPFFVMVWSLFSLQIWACGPPEMKFNFVHGAGCNRGVKYIDRVEKTRNRGCQMFFGSGVQAKKVCVFLQIIESVPRTPLNYLGWEGFTPEWNIYSRPSVVLHVGCMQFVPLCRDSAARAIRRFPKNISMRLPCNDVLAFTQVIGIF